MKSKWIGHIIAFMLAGLVLFQAVFVLIPEEEKVLCLADDHIAIEMPDAMSPVPPEKDPSGLFSMHDYHSSNDHNCIDIPLQTRTVRPGNSYSSLPGVCPILFFSTVENTPISAIGTLTEYPGTASGPCPVCPQRYADRSRVFLI